MTILRRDFECEIRADSDGGRTVHGVIVPFGETADVQDRMGQTYKEKFARGSFERSIRERGSKIRLFSQHDHQAMPVGKAVELREEDRGLVGSFEIAPTRAGEDALALVRGGYVQSFSVGFAPIADEEVDGVVVRTEASLREVSLVHSPAYSGAAIEGVRSVHVDEVLTRLRRGDPKAPYGPKSKVTYADPGWLPDGKARYPLDTEAHCRAAISYLSQKKNAAKYSADQLAKMWAKIRAAAKKFGIEMADRFHTDIHIQRVRLRLARERGR
jgi:Escherichia/Staphylococcus phage prohead protease